MIHILTRHSVLFIVVASVCELASGQNAPDSGAEFSADDFRDAATRYEITTVGEPDEPFELVSKPLLTWSNPERRTPSGVVYLYTHHGRPQVALCVYPNVGALDHEFQSLSSELLLGKRDGTLVWTPRSAGMEMQPIDEASPPGATPFLRLREMRNFSRTLEAAIVIPNGSPKPLRLLTTPVYRYPPDGLPKGIIDGAVFAFVQSTDPEVLLVVEAREDSAGARQWYFGLARMSMVRLNAHLDGKEIWKAEWAVPNPTSPYYTIGGN